MRYYAWSEGNSAYPAAAYQSKAKAIKRAKEINEKVPHTCATWVTNDSGDLIWESR